MEVSTPKTERKLYHVRIHSKKGGKTASSCMMQFSLRFWSGYLHQPKKYYSDSLSFYFDAFKR